MGKTAGNAVWLDANKTSPFDFYQYWRNVGDADVMKCLKMLTFIPLEQLKEMEKWDDSRINEKKMILAHELTEMVHGKEEADNAVKISEEVFSKGFSEEGMPEADVKLTDNMNIMDLLVAIKVAPSKSEARRLITGNGISLNSEKVSDPNMEITEDLFKDTVIISKGKKVHVKVNLVK